MMIGPEESQRMFDVIVSMTMINPVLMGVFYTIFVASFIGLAVYLVKTSKRTSDKEN